MALAGAAGLRVADEDPIDLGEYVFTLFLSGQAVFDNVALFLARKRRRLSRVSRRQPAGSGKASGEERASSPGSET